MSKKVLKIVEVLLTVTATSPCLVESSASALATHIRNSYGRLLPGLDTQHCVTRVKSVSLKDVRGRGIAVERERIVSVLRAHCKTVNPYGDRVISLSSKDWQEVLWIDHEGQPIKE